MESKGIFILALPGIAVCFSVSILFFFCLFFLQASRKNFLTYSETSVMPPHAHDTCRRMRMKGAVACVVGGIVCASLIGGAAKGTYTARCRGLRLSWRLHRQNFTFADNTASYAG